MEAQRELQILRVIVKEMLREKGVQFDQDLRRGTSNETKKWNERYKIDPPIRPSELGEVALPLLLELMSDHAQKLDQVLADLKVNGK